MKTISSNHYSHDQQLSDAVDSLDEEQAKKFKEAFPEWDNLVWTGSWIDTEKSKVDVEYSSWATDWIEDNTKIFWEEGEPWISDENDEDEDD